MREMKEEWPMPKDIVSLDGTKISYRIHRYKSKRFLVFIHGLSGNSTAFNPIMKSFNIRGVSTLAMELRGHGRSNKRAEITIEKCALDLDHILKKEGIEKCTLVGHCFGGPIALEFYKMFPKKVESMVLMNSTYSSPFAERKIDERIKNLLLKILNKSLEYHRPVRKRFLYNNCELYKKSGLMFILLKDLLANPTETYIKSFIAYFNNNQEPLLSKIKVPVLIISGKKDVYISYKASEFMSNRIKGSKLIILEKADHIPLIRNPKLIFEILSDFCVT